MTLTNMNLCKSSKMYHSFTQERKHDCPRKTIFEPYLNSQNALSFNVKTNVDFFAQPVSFVHLIQLVTFGM